MVKKVILSFAVVLLAAMFATATGGTVSRVFQLEHISVADASVAVQPLLTETGSLTLQPKQSRIVVQDEPIVIDKVAALIRDLDHAPGQYSIEVDLLEGGEVTPYGTADEYKAEERLYKMFKSTAFYMVGSSTIEGRLGEPFQTDLGTSYRISFVPQLPDASNSSPWGVRDPGNQLHLRQLVLERKGIASDGTVMTFELLRTNVLLAPKQTVYIGAGSSEDSGDVLVLIVHAREFGSR